MEDETNDRIDGDLTTEELMNEIVEALTVPADSKGEENLASQGV